MWTACILVYQQLVHNETPNALNFSNSFFGSCNDGCFDLSFVKVDAADHWLCYMCCPTQNCVGLLAKREDWDMQLHQLFLNDNKMEFVSA